MSNVHLLLLFSPSLLPSSPFSPFSTFYLSVSVWSVHIKFFIAIFPLALHQKCNKMSLSIWDMGDKLSPHEQLTEIEAGLTAAHFVGRHHDKLSLLWLIDDSVLLIALDSKSTKLSLDLVINYTHHLMVCFNCRVARGSPGSSIMWRWAGFLATVLASPCRVAATTLTSPTETRP